MAAQSTATRSSAFNVGWIALLAIAVLGTIGYTILIFAMREEATVFVGWGAFTLYAALVLYIPFRRGERWAWYTSWILVIGFAAPILFTRESFAVWDLIAAGVMALSLLLTRPAFFQSGPHAS